MDKGKLCSITGTCGTSLLGLFCPFCIPAIATFLLSMGLGALIRPEVLWSIFGFMGLLLTLGLLAGYKRHKNMFPLLLGITGIGITGVGSYIIFSFACMYIGVAIVLTATAWNFLLCQKMRCR